MTNMARQAIPKINQLLRKWPSGTPATIAWLEAEGFSRQLIDAYEKSHWVKRLSRGVVIREEESINWVGAVYALQTFQKLPIHPGGKLALSLRGLAHFLQMSTTPKIYLYGPSEIKLPAWIKGFGKQLNINYYRSKLFKKAGQIVGFTDYKENNLRIKVSSPERATLEVLDLVPKYQSFEEAKLIFEGLTTLRSSVVQRLLENCESYKVKRTFLYLAEASGHAWFKKIDVRKIDLGKGKRVVAENGKFDSKYLITVPRDE